MAREDRVVVMLEQGIKERIQYYASAMGLSASALGAFILGNWVMQQDRANGPLLDEMKKMMLTAMQEQMDGMVDLVANGDLPEKIMSELRVGDPAHVEQGGVAPND